MRRTTKTRVIPPHRMSNMIIGDSPDIFTSTGFDLVREFVARSVLAGSDRKGFIGGSNRPICRNYSPVSGERLKVQAYFSSYFAVPPSFLLFWLSPIPRLIPVAVGLPLYCSGTTTYVQCRNYEAAPRVRAPSCNLSCGLFNSSARSRRRAVG